MIHDLRWVERKTGRHYEGSDEYETVLQVRLKDINEWFDVPTVKED